MWDQGSALEQLPQGEATTDSLWARRDREFHEHLSLLGVSGGVGPFSVKNMARAVIRVTWKNDGAVRGQNHSASVNINETRRILTGTSNRNHQETGPFHLVGTSFYETHSDRDDPDVAILVDTFRDMLLHFVNRLPNGNPRAEVETVSLTLWNIVEGADPDRAEEVLQLEVEPHDLSDVVDQGEPAA